MRSSVRARAYPSTPTPSLRRTPCCRSRSAPLWARTPNVVGRLVSRNAQDRSSCKTDRLPVVEHLVEARPTSLAALGPSWTPYRRLYPIHSRQGGITQRNTPQNSHHSPSALDPPQSFIEPPHSRCNTAKAFCRHRAYTAFMWSAQSARHEVQGFMTLALRSLLALELAEPVSARSRKRRSLVPACWNRASYRLSGR